VAASGEGEWADVSGERVVIFVTVGAQMPFDRLVKAVDTWAGERGRDDVFAQIGRTDFRPSRIHSTTFVDPVEFKRRFEAAEVIVAHAGMGSIITALQMGKPIIVMPRRASLLETRNDHQVATAEHFRHFESVVVAWDEKELPGKLDGIDGLAGRRAVGPYASRELIETVRRFIDGIDVRFPT
jgi:UDP-N-acetylglucosamine transferase subunit ALG13